MDEHGTPEAYRRGCRCYECRIAESQYVMARRKDPGRVSARRARARIQSLHARGYTYTQIADACGLGKAHTSRIVRGVYRTILKRTEQAILTAQMKPTVHYDSEAIVSAASERGLSVNEVERICGFSENYLWTALSRPTIPYERLDAIACAIGCHPSQFEVRV